MAEIDEKKALESLGLTTQDLNEKETETEQETAEPEIDTSKFSAVQLEAYNAGWKPKEFFEGDEENWLSASRFLEHNRTIKSNQELRAELRRSEERIEQRLKGTQALLEAQAKERLEQLEKERWEAIGIADVDEARAKEQKIEQVKKSIEPIKATAPVTQSAVTVPAEVTAWEARNTWINDEEDVRTPVAKDAYVRYLAKNPGCSPSDAIAYVDSKVQQLNHPANSNINPRRSSAAGSEINTRATTMTRKTGEITMQHLTPLERKQWDNPTVRETYFFNDEKIFLDSVARARKINQQRRENYE